MLLKVDAAQLEWRVKVFFAQDQVAMKEIELMDEGKYDIHNDNQEKFKLPSRVIAKNFVYQMIFQDVFGDQGMRGAGQGFAHKADFIHVFGEDSKKVRVEKWTEVAQSFFDKYEGIYRDSLNLVRTATHTGRVVVPSGRFYIFKPESKYNQELDWPRTKILNYPVQGFSADLVQVARLTLCNKLKKWPEWSKYLLLINTVHDDIEADVDNNPELLYNTCIEMEEAFRSIPQEFERMYGSKINVPMAGEVKFGVNLNEASMVKFKKKSFEQDYKDYIAKHGNATIRS